MEFNFEPFFLSFTGHRTASARLPQVGRLMRHTARFHRSANRKIANHQQALRRH